MSEMPVTFKKVYNPQIVGRKALNSTPKVSVPVTFWCATYTILATKIEIK